MAKKRKRKPIDWGQVIGAIIFMSLFLGLIFLGMVGEKEGKFESSFFEDISKVMEGQY